MKSMVHGEIYRGTNSDYPRQTLKGGGGSLRYVKNVPTNPSIIPAALCRSKTNKKSRNIKKETTDIYCRCDECQNFP